MPTVNKIRAGFAVCDNCGAKSRTIGWALTERLQMGYQGLGSVKLCPDCLATEREALVALPAFVEELKDTLRAYGVAFSASARREDLQALVDALPRVRPDAPTPPPPIPTGSDASAISTMADGESTISTEFLMGLTRDQLVEEAIDRGLQKPPENATKAEIVKRIQAKVGEAT